MSKTAAITDVFVSTIGVSATIWKTRSTYFHKILTSQVNVEVVKGTGVDYAPKKFIADMPSCLRYRFCRRKC